MVPLKMSRIVADGLSTKACEPRVASGAPFVIVFVTKLPRVRMGALVGWFNEGANAIVYLLIP